MQTKRPLAAVLRPLARVPNIFCLQARRKASCTSAGACEVSTHTSGGTSFVPLTYFTCMHDLPAVYHQTITAPKVS